MRPEAAFVHGGELPSCQTPSGFGRPIGDDRCCDHQWPRTASAGETNFGKVECGLEL